MAKIYETIAALITPARLKTGAATLEVKEHKVTAASEIILPSVLATMLKKGDGPQMEELLNTGRKIKAWENYDTIWRGSGVDQGVNLGERAENRILGPLGGKLNTAVGHITDIRTGNVDRLSNWVCATVAAWFSQQIAGGKSYKVLLGELEGEKEALHRKIPGQVVQLLGLSAFFGPGEHKVDDYKSAAATPRTLPVVPPDKKASLGWLWWLLGLIALILLIFLIVRSCGHRPTVVEGVAATTGQLTPVAGGAAGDAAGDAAGAVAGAVAGATATVTNALNFEGHPMTLPDGTHITMYKGHLEEAVKAYLDSNKFRNGTDADLRGVWFEFTDIEFEHNTATELMTGSPERLLALVNVLKAYPDVKVMVGSFGDRTGTRAANYAISEKRALTIIETLKTAGFPAANLSHEGFGKEFAAVPATASNAERAPDRDVAMRFTK